MRINAYMSRTGYCSRRETIRLIQAERITINGEVAKQTSEVVEGDLVLLDGKPIPSKGDPVYLAYHKPVGVVCTAAPDVKNNIIASVNYPERVFPIGRLDKDSEGLILLTNDGTIVNRMMKSEFGHEKEYLVTVDKEVTKEFLTGMANGVQMLGTVTKPCMTGYVSPNQFRIILTQGLNRQIRRMCKHFDYRVLRLQRFRIMTITLEGLREGTWRHLTKAEVEEIKRQLNLDHNAQ